MIRELFFGLIALLAVLSIPLTLLAGWLTHVVHTIQAEQWLLLIAGAILFPIAIVHGIGIWFGLF